MIFDTLVLVVLLLSALHAFWRGFIREVLMIFGAIGGGLAAVAYGDDMRPFMDSMLGITTDETPAKLLGVIPLTLVAGAMAYGAVFILIFGILSFLSHLIAEQVRAVGLGPVDRSLGVVFGLIRGIIILAIFYLPVHIVMDDEKKTEWFKTSRTHFVIAGAAQMLENALPENILPFKDKEKEKNQPKADGETPRETLEKMDLLKGGPDTDQKSPSESTGTKAPPAQEQGYSDKQRDMMNTLIDKGSSAAKDAVQNMPPEKIDDLMKKLPDLLKQTQ